jgi:MoaA/NifB/PqqE/SkfB family radical SAM enzyme
MYSGPELDLGQLLSVVDQYKRFLKNQGFCKGHINVTGGEPFMRKDLFDFFEVLSSQRKTFNFALLTNGSFISKDIAEMLKNLKPSFVQVSIDGGDETHDNIRGRGNHSTVIQAINNLRHAGIKTLISFTAHKGNFREFESVAELGRKLGVSNIWTDRFIPAGTRSTMADNVLSKEETHGFFSIVMKAKQKIEGKWRHQTTISMNRALQFILGDGEPYRCSAGENLLTIGTDGSLYPCRRMPVSIGNVTSTDLSCLYAERVNENETLPTNI